MTKIQKLSTILGGKPLLFDILFRHGLSKDFKNHTYAQTVLYDNIGDILRCGNINLNHPQSEQITQQVENFLFSEPGKKYISAGQHPITYSFNINPDGSIQISLDIDNGSKIITRKFAIKKSELVLNYNEQCPGLQPISQIKKYPPSYTHSNER